MRRVSLCLSVVALLIVVKTSGGPSVRAQQSGCTGSRWDVKTLTDADVGDVDLTRVIGVNISTLAAIPPPDPLPDNSRFDPYETTIYTVTGNVINARLQPDHDIVLVLQDANTGDTMSVNFPDAAQCATGAAPQFLSLMEQARTAFVQAFGMPGPSGSTPLRGSATVTGVGFLDQVQGQDGEAPNGFELHPVLQLQASTSPVSGSTLVPRLGKWTSATGTTGAPTATVP
jgi:hypothetical protein